MLARVAEVMEAHRTETLTAMATTTGKTLREGDPEISEAIDFALFASHLTRQHEDLSQRLDWQPHGVVLIAGPWNFPYAIPASGLVHALAAGSAALLKPAPEARAVGALLVAQLHEAGVDPDLVQLIATPDDEVASTWSPTTASTRSCSPAAWPPRISSSAGSPTCTCTPRPAARTPSSSPRPPISIWRSRTS